MIVGITGYAGSGKDTAADYLVSKYGYERRGLADPIRQALYALNPQVAVGQTLRVVVDWIGWDGAKRQFPEVRRLLQVFGTEVGRETFGSEFWLNLFDDWLYERSPTYQRNVVVPDVRFKNEAEFLKTNYGAKLLHITRQGVEALNSHASEAGGLDAYVTHTIQNDSTIQALHAKIDLMMEGLG